MNEAPLATWIVASSPSGTCCRRGRRHQDVADLLRRLAKLRLQAHDEVEQLLALHDLRGGDAAHRRLDQAVDVVGVEAIAGELGPVDA